MRPRARVGPADPARAASSRPGPFPAKSGAPARSCCSTVPQPISGGDVAVVPPAGMSVLERTDRGTRSVRTALIRRIPAKLCSEVRRGGLYVHWAQSSRRLSTHFSGSSQHDPVLHRRRTPCGSTLGTQAGPGAPSATAPSRLPGGGPPRPGWRSWKTVLCSAHSWSRTSPTAAPVRCVRPSATPTSTLAPT